MRARHLILLTLPLLLPACKGGEQPPAAPSGAAVQPPVVDSGAVPSTVPPLPSAAPGEPDPATTIPTAMQGRWGLVPADCTSTLGDAKGLLKITANTLVFYESQGKLTRITEREDDHLEATFAFTGEGMEWTRTISFDVLRAGGTLITHTTGGDAPAENLTYTRC